MNHKGKFFYISISVVLSVLVHCGFFALSRNIPVTTGYFREFTHKPSRYLKLGTVSINMPKILKDDRKTKFIPSHKEMRGNLSGALPQTAGLKSSAAKTAETEEFVSGSNLPTSPQLPTVVSPAKIIEIDGDKLPPNRIEYGRLIIPKFPESDFASAGRGGSNGQYENSVTFGDDTIPLKMKIPVPKKRHGPEMPPTSDTRLLSPENASILDSLMDVKLSKYCEPDGSGYFKIDIKPSGKGRLPEPFKKDIVFCIDVSGSISQAKLNEFRQGVERAVLKLSRDDRFEIASFRHKAYRLFGSLEPPTQANLKKASEFLFKLERSGCTNIYSALEPFTSAKFKTEGRPLLLFLASDGMVNSGEISDSRILINEISNRNQDNASIFTFNSGKEGNPFLLELIAYRNRGERMNLEQIQSGGSALENFIEEVSGIVVMNLDYQVSSQLAGFTFPKKLPHLYANHTLSVIGRFPPAVKEIGLRITGTDSSGKKQELVCAGNLEDAPISDSLLPKSWALQYIYHLYSSLTANYDDSLRLEIHSTAQRYGLNVPYLDNYLLRRQNYVEE